MEAAGGLLLGSDLANGPSFTTNVVLSGGIRLGGEAYLTAVPHGLFTMVANGGIALGYRPGLMHESSDPYLPPTDTIGWLTPTRTPPAILSMTIVAGGFPLLRSQIGDLTIELDDEGGPKSATLRVRDSLMRQPKMLSSLLVTYLSTTLFRGRLESLTTEVGSEAGYTLTYAGPLVTLRDHKAFRTVFIDSDLANWCTDQGRNTTTEDNPFEIQQDEDALVISVTGLAPPGD
jgi:hypothetical protein